MGKNEKTNLTETHFLKLIYFNQRIVTLQYCGGFFCHTLTCIPMADS